jgi:hypothetical protein
MEVQSLDPFGFIDPESHPLRRFFAKFLLATPALMTLAVTVWSQATEDPYHPAPVGQELNQRIDAYVPVVQATALANDPIHTLEPERARKYARIWIDGMERGQLKPLLLGSYEDSIFDGVIGQIVRADFNIANSLDLAAFDRANEGDFAGAVDDALLSMKVCEVIKYSDPLANSLVGARYRKSMHVIRSAAKQLGPEKRERIVAALKQFRTDESRFDGMLLGMYDLYMREHPAGARGEVSARELPMLRAEGKIPSKRALLNLLHPDPKSTVRDEVHDQFLVLAKRSVENEKTTQAELNRTLQMIEAPAL